MNIDGTKSAEVKIGDRLYWSVDTPYGKKDQLHIVEHLSFSSLMLGNGYLQKHMSIEGFLSSVYTTILDHPHDDWRTNNQFLYSNIRDEIAYYTGKTHKEIQEEHGA